MQLYSEVERLPQMHRNLQLEQSLMCVALKISTRSAGDSLRNSSWTAGLDSSESNDRLLAPRAFNNALFSAVSCRVSEVDSHLACMSRVVY
jgi:hypothetical protein